MLTTFYKIGFTNKDSEILTFLCLVLFVVFFLFSNWAEKGVMSQVVSNPNTLLFKTQK